MWMLELGRDLDLAEESLRPNDRRQIGSEHLHRDQAVVLQVLRQGHGGHPAGTELTLDGGSGRQRRLSDDRVHQAPG
jgi:hypothetical protein